MSKVKRSRQIRDSFVVALALQLIKDMVGRGAWNRIAERLDVYPPQVSNWSRGMYTPDPKYRKMLADWSGIPEEFMCFNANAPEMTRKVPGWRWTNKRDTIHKRKHRAKHPQRSAARIQTTLAIERGEVIRPARCEQCKRGCLPEAHHDDYYKPLEITWLCKQCHRKRHNEQKKTCNAK